MLLKVLSLGNMAGILAQRSQLDTLITLTSRWKWENGGELDTTSTLMDRASTVLKESMHRDGGFAGIDFWGRKASIRIDGQPKQEGYFTPERSRLLLSRLWEQRDIMLSTFSHSPVPGFGTVLLVISANSLKDTKFSPSE